jgi:hypothetical protein
MSENRRKKQPAGADRRLQSGYWTAKKALSRFGLHCIDGRSSVAKALNELREDLVRDLGGPEAISTQQNAIIGVALRTHLLLESLDAFIFSMNSPVNKRRRSVYPIVRERQALADALARYMAMLGLEKRKPPAKSLTEYLAEKSTGTTTAVPSPSEDVPAKEIADVCKEAEEAS